LGIGVAVDVSLGRHKGPMTCQYLHIAQRATCPVDQPGGASDEGAAARMGGAAFQTDSAVRISKLIHNASWPHRVAALGRNHKVCGWADLLLFTPKIKQSGRSPLDGRYNMNSASE